jgi:hypothetical protein
MSSSIKLLTLSTLLASAAALAQPTAPAPARAEQPVFNAGSQYTASLDQTNNLWRLQPVDGEDVVIDAGSCATGAMVAPGVWLLVIGRDGRPELLAPSVTALPVGSPDRVALRGCDQASGHELAVPASVLELLTETTGAIYVSN